MPIYAYRCACGKTADVLVRGREPQSCDDVPELSGSCLSESSSGPGALSRMITAPYVGRGGSISESGPAAGESCGHCGNTPSSCDN